MKGLPKKPILVTGASGYLGGALLAWLGRLGGNAVGFSRSRDKGFRTYEELQTSMSGAEAVVHCAAVTRFFGDPEEITRVNGQWPVELYREADEAGVPTFVFISSIAVHGYWNRPPLTVTEAAPIGARRSRLSD